MNSKAVLLDHQSSRQLSALKQPTPKQSAKERLLVAASRLFYTKGVRVVGVDDILALAGTTKASFYKYFPSKDHLIVAFLQSRDATWRKWLHETIENLSPDPAGRPLAIFDALAQRFASKDFRGCAFTNCIFEVADQSHPVHMAADDHKNRVMTYICDVLQSAGVANAQRLACEWMMLIDGAIVTAVRVGDPWPAMAAKRMAHALLQGMEPDGEPKRQHDDNAQTPSKAPLSRS